MSDVSKELAARRRAFQGHAQSLGGDVERHVRAVEAQGEAVGSTLAFIQA